MTENHNSWKTLFENEKYEICCEFPHCIRNKKSKRILKPRVNLQGYLQICLHHSGKKVYYLVHRLIVNNLMGGIPKGMCIDHINNIKTDNRIENLRIVSYNENNINKEYKETKFVYFNESEWDDLTLINHDGIYFNPFTKKFYRHIYRDKFRELKTYFNSKYSIAIRYGVNGKTINVKINENWHVIGLGNTSWCDIMDPKLASFSLNEVSMMRRLASEIIEKSNSKYILWQPELKE